MQQISILWLCTCMSTINYMESTDCILLSNLAFPVAIKLNNYLVLVGNSAVCVVAIVQLNIKG